MLRFKVLSIGFLGMTVLNACSLVRTAPGEPTSEPERTATAVPDPSRTAGPPSTEAGPAGPTVRQTYEVFGETYPVWTDAAGYVEEGVASWYGEELSGRPTASGEPFDPYAMTAAHRSLPLGTRVEVENLENGRTVIVRVNDRGPFVEGRIIDLALAAAQALGFAAQGTARVEVRSLD